MSRDEQIEIAKESELIDSDGNPNNYPVQDIAEEAMLKAEYNEILINLIMEEV